MEKRVLSSFAAVTSIGTTKSKLNDASTGCQHVPNTRLNADWISSGARRGDQVLEPGIAMKRQVLRPDNGASYFCERQLIIPSFAIVAATFVPDAISADYSPSA